MYMSKNINEEIEDKDHFNSILNSNNVKVDGNNVIISTEDGIYIYLIK